MISRLRFAFSFVIAMLDGHLGAPILLHPLKPQHCFRTRLDRTNEWSVCRIVSQQESKAVRQMS